ncbi:Putative 1-phosphatidylinositol-3-phosphate 5-kinase FAB1D [Apostasia shenzhenica]|uniref:1-phosphatidylinositol-3-phosphate 5-kinase n=1 Tax=Apostasia shenzhenica TaxID=1088818 RepID=A0A2I0A863_9ASPA|nr:Putative 1-phosphatidylinositol-3-phosphate 5-kinase FAB1D [Apostasia shenzhenica]
MPFFSFQLVMMDWCRAYVSLCDFCSHFGEFREIWAGAVLSLGFSGFESLGLGGVELSTQGSGCHCFDCKTPPTAASPSFSSDGNCVSRYSNHLAEVDTKHRIALDTGQMPEHLGSNEQLGLLGNLVDCSIADKALNNARIQMSLEVDSSAIPLTVEGSDDFIAKRVGHYNGSSVVVQSATVNNNVEKTVDVSQSFNALLCTSVEADPLFWMPPEAEVKENAADSVAYDDDDDDCNDGMRWGQPSSLTSIDDEHAHNQSHKEQRQKVMMEVMNGQFKILVSRFLASEGIGLAGDDVEKEWINIVTSLSWEAALLVKPDAGEGRSMDPGSYVKVKCVASGSRSQSQVIKGLVFKKSAAHKHMPTEFRNASLMLLKGSLGHSTSGLSSFESMGQEKEHLKSIMAMIDNCHPNVVLVEKSVSRDIQEALLTKGITLVFDMKLPRLERIARCTGSHIISLGDTMSRPILKRCDFFHIDKFVEEHNSSLEGKRLMKTLLFFEGCPKPLGCTILLKGANSEQLKKIKHALHYTVFAAYHLILETSFFVDQSTFFSDMNTHTPRETNDMSAVAMVNPENCETAVNLNFLGLNDSLPSIHSADTIDIPVSGGSLMSSMNKDIQYNSDAEAGMDSLGDMHKTVINSGEILQSVSDVSASVKRILGDRLTPLTSESVLSYFGLKENMDDNNVSVVVSPSVETFDNEKKLQRKFLEKGNCDFYIGAKADNLSELIEVTDIQIDESTKEMRLANKIEMERKLDLQSILVLMSSLCITKKAACEESHLLRIKYYGNFDVSLGRYMQDVLLSQKYTCSSCGEPSEAHIYRYTHQNGNLTAVVRLLPRESVLPGEAEGKIWMWSRCLRCEHENGTPKVTRRVVMSSAARGLSFGKFLDLSFSDQSADNRLARCGHLLHRDCLRFFGLGSKVAMFRYSPVEIYSACKPQPVLEFHNQNGDEWLSKVAKDILAKGELLFGEISDALRNLKSQGEQNLPQQSTSFSETINQINEMENMLKQEKTSFEASVLGDVNLDVRQGKNVGDVRDINLLRQELRLLFYIWDRRLHFLVCRMLDSSSVAVTKDLIHEDDSSVSCDNFVEDGKERLMQVPIIVEDVSSDDESQHSGNHGMLEKELEIESARLSGDASCNDDIVPGMCSFDAQYRLGDFSSSSSSKDSEEECVPILEHLQEEYSIPLPIESMNYVQEANDLEYEAYSEKPTASQQSCNSDAEDPDLFIWTSFSELQKAFRKDLHGSYLHKFQFINDYNPRFLPRVHKLIADSGGNVFSVADDEISSIIAYALALSKNRYSSAGNTTENEGTRERDHAIENSQRPTVILPYSPSTGSLESEGTRSSSSDELPSLGSDSPLYVDQLALNNLHPEIILGTEKIAGKSKYSVVCIYAKEFYSLRRKCCPSEMAYISSLSRCKKWDAQGGKSKVFFAKTLDDRFIIKQIKKTELDSFLKFGPEYFKYLSFSLDSGSQTCLAKILGIYQVRQIKHGKEVRTDLMILENLLFGRNISRKYDLKGSVFSRYVSGAGDQDKVLLDENFVEDMRVSPIYVGGRTKQLLQRAIWNDTSFLTLSASPAWLCTDSWLLAGCGAEGNATASLDLLRLNSVHQASGSHLSFHLHSNCEGRSLPLHHGSSLTDPLPPLPLWS